MYWPEVRKANKLLNLNLSTTHTVNDNFQPTVNHSQLKSNPVEEFDITEFSRFCKIRDRVRAWASPWGGSWAWHHKLESEYQKATKENRVEEWVGEMLNHADIGRDLLDTLSSMEGHLPNSDWQVKELWRIEVELLRLITQGLAALEVRINLLSDTMHGLLSNYQWSRNKEEDEGQGEEEQDEGEGEGVEDRNESG